MKWMKWLKKRLAILRDDKGQAIVEFALVLPLMMMMLTGIFMFSVAMYSKTSLQSAANQGVQTLVMSQGLPNGVDPCTEATTAIHQSTNLNSSLMTITYYNGTPAAGTIISTGSTCEKIASGTALSVKLQYPCSLAIYNFAKSCQLTATQTESVP